MRHVGHHEVTWITDWCSRVVSKLRLMVKVVWVVMLRVWSVVMVGVVMVGSCTLMSYTFLEALGSCFCL